MYARQAGTQARRAARSAQTRRRFGHQRPNRGPLIDLLCDLMLVLTFLGQTTWAIEIKGSSSPTLSRGFYQAATDVGAACKLRVAPVEHSYPTKEWVEVVDVMTAVGLVRAPH